MNKGRPQDSSDPFGLAGQVLDGQFRVEKLVGEGGFGIVYRGHHIGLDAPIAIKCLKLPPTLGTALVDSFVAKFRDESKLHYRLSQGNLNIVRSIASGTTMSPSTSALVPYMVLEWLEGRSLAQEFELRRARGEKGRSLAEVVALLDSAVDALAYAHSQGVIHRDVNPGNLYLATTRDGLRLKVLDFGVAKIVSDHALAMGPRAQTIGQIRIFAPAYGAPEQFDDAFGEPGAWTDVYSLALIALEAMSDRTVVDGEHLGEFALRTLDPDRRPSPRAHGLIVSDAVERVFARALALSPKERFRDVGEFWGELKNVLRREIAAAHPPAPDGNPMRTLAMAERPRNWNASEISPLATTAPLIELQPKTLRMPSRPASAAPIDLGTTLPLAQEVPATVSSPVLDAFANLRASTTTKPRAIAESTPAPVPATLPTSRPSFAIAFVVVALLIVLALGAGAYFAVAHIRASVAAPASS